MERSVKVHITLTDDVLDDEQATSDAIEKLEQIGVHAVNQRRARRYGIVSGEIDPAALDEVRALPGILAVEADDLKHAL